MARILVIDDDNVVRTLICEILARAGHEVVDASDGLKGERKYHECPMDMVITDIFMPEKDGLEIIRQLRKTNPKVKIIAVSGGAYFMKDQLALDIAENLGAGKTLSKPLVKEELLEAVSDLLDGR